MTLSKKKFGISIALLCAAFACGIFYSFVDLMLGRIDSLSTYDFRYNLTMNLVALTPVLFTLIIMGLHKATGMNPRTLLICLFSFYIIQFLLMLATDTRGAAVMYLSTAPAYYNIAVISTILLRVLTLILLPVMSRGVFRAYTVLSAFILLISSINLHIDYNASEIATAITLLSDFLFLSALFIFAQTLESGNEFKAFRKKFDSFAKPVMKFFDYDEDEFDEEFDYYDEDEDTEYFSTEEEDSEDTVDIPKSGTDDGFTDELLEELRRIANEEYDSLESDYSSRPYYEDNEDADTLPYKEFCFNDYDEPHYNSGYMVENYHKLCLYGLFIKDEDFLAAHKFISKLAKDNISCGTDSFVTKEMCIPHIRSLVTLTEKLNSMYPYYLHSGFSIRLDLLMEKAETEAFVFEVIDFAVKVTDKKLFYRIRALDIFRIQILSTYDAPSFPTDYQYIITDDSFKDEYKECFRDEAKKKVLLVRSEDVSKLLEIYDDIAAIYPHRTVLDSETFNEIFVDNAIVTDKFTQAELLVIWDMQYFIGKIESQKLIAEIIRSRLAENKPTILIADADILSCGGVCEELRAAAAGTATYLIP